MREKLVILQTLALLLSVALAAGCSKNGNDRSRDDYKGVGEALDGPDDTNGSGASRPPAPVAGVDLSKLGESEKKQFAKLLDRLQSPCGKTHSLRKSLNDDHTCKRAIFAARYVAVLVGEALDELSVRAAYDGRYRNETRHDFDISRAPHIGARNAPIVIVEFLDYG